MEATNIADYLLENKPEVPSVDGNAFAIMGVTQKALEQVLRDSVFSDKEVNNFIGKLMDDAMSGDYNHLLRVCSTYVNFGGL